MKSNYESKGYSTKSLGKNAMEDLGEPYCAIAEELKGEIPNASFVTHTCIVQRDDAWRFPLTTSVSSH